MKDATNTQYHYKDIPITSTIVEDLVLQLFTGKIELFQTIMDEVLKHHKANGGAPSKAQNQSGTFSRALTNLQKKDYLISRLTVIGALVK